MPKEGEFRYDAEGGVEQWQNGKWVKIQSNTGQHLAMVQPTVEKVSDKDDKEDKK